VKIHNFLNPTMQDTSIANPFAHQPNLIQHNQTTPSSLPNIMDKPSPCIQRQMAQDHLHSVRFS
jgi:hypothetical protein